MKSAKEQAFWVSYGLGMVLLIGGSGFYLFQSLGGYGQSSGEFERQKTQKKKLESAAIYPNQANVEKLTASVTEFETSVKALHDQLKAYQRPLDTISDQQFPQELKAMIEAFRKYAFDKRVVVPEGFYFGMTEYASTLPKPAATGILKYQLDSVDYLLRMIVDQGADEIISVDREQTALEKTVEAGQEVVDPEKTQQVAKYPVKISFVTSHDGFRNFLNLVSNDKKFFYIVRVLRVDNEVKGGPPKAIEEKRLAKDPTTGEVTEVVEGQDVLAAGLQEYDARVIFGNEKLRVSAVIDLCRFPEVVAAPDGPPQSGPVKPGSGKPGSGKPGPRSPSGRP
jgi:hypothetical protein